LGEWWQIGLKINGEGNPKSKRMGETKLGTTDFFEEKNGFMN